MRNLRTKAIGAIAATVLGLAPWIVRVAPSHAEPVVAIGNPTQGKFAVNPMRPETGREAVADVEALVALQAIPTPLDNGITIFEYRDAVRQAKLAIERAESAADTFRVRPLREALNTHLLALQFWNDCLLARNDFLCDEKRPSVAAILRRYAIPRRAERLNSAVEIARRYPRPWIVPRVRATLREVVEYIPAGEQQVAMLLLWREAQLETTRAAASLGML